MKHMRHWLMMVMLLCGITANAHDFEVDGIFYNITSSSDLTVEVTYRGKYADSFSNEYSGAVTIPSTVTYNSNTYSVTSIGEYAFYDCRLTSFTISNGVTRIGEYAFSGCSRLTSITIPNGVTYIGYFAFSGCSRLTSITIPNGVTYIGDDAFYRCSSLTSITIPENSQLTSIGNSAFKDCTSLTSITIPENSQLTSIGNSAFKDCTSLTSITIPENSQLTSIGEYAFSGTAWYDNQPDGVVYAGNVLYNYKGTMSENTSIEVKEGTVSISPSAFSGCSSLTSITIPEGVTSIGEFAFLGCSSLTSITIPESVISIGFGAFWGTAWYDNLPDGVIYAGKVLYQYKGTMPANTIIEVEEGTISICPNAFYDCSNLTSITLPESVTSIEGGAFQLCSLTSITIPNGVTYIGECAFQCCSLTSITIPEGVTSIEFGAFSYCISLTSITIPASVTSIGECAFSGCSSLTSITIPASVTSIGLSAFYGCSSLTSITIPASVTSIGEGAFSDCISLTSITIPTSVTSIGECAFSGCSSLTSITIPASVTSIGLSAFSDCENLKEVYCFTLEPIQYNSFFDDSPIETIYVPAYSLDLYMEADGWKDFNILPFVVSSNLVVNFSTEVSGKYHNIYIELTDSVGKVINKYLIGDKQSFTFYNLDGNQIYNVYIKNQSGHVLGVIQDIHINGDTNVTFDSLLQPQNLKVGIYTPDGTDVTESAIVTWVDVNNNYLSKGAALSGQVENTEVKYSVKLSKELAMQYKQPEQTTYMVKPSGNEIKVVLEPFASVEVMGIVRDSVTGIPVRDAMVTFSQKLNGEYAHITRAETDSKGAFKATLYDVPAEVTVATADYISYTMLLDTLTEATALGEILMKPISGVVVSVGFTYRTSVPDGDTPEILGWYTDYANVKYGILNKTTGLPVSNVSVQYPQLVLLDGVSAGDELLLTVVSRTSSFEPTQTAVVVDSALRCDATFDIVELGGIEASYTTTTNSAVVGILYNEIGEMVQKRSYSSGSLTIDNLRDGSYTLVTMGSSDYFNAIYNLAQLSAVGLVEGTDYMKHAVKVESGVVSVVEMESVPAFDESKLYYTGGDTRFTVNKTSASAGNYLTLTGKIDFKEEYASKVSDVSMVIDLPESAVFVDNSVMVGAAIAPCTLEGNRLTISLPNNYTERVRFCIIPTEGGSYAPTAFAQFTIDGKKVLQPIGSAHYTIKDLSINVPGTVAKTTIPVSGTAIGQSAIQIYDNDVLIGETTSLANGVWSATCKLHEPYNLSKHRIHAKVTTKLGVELISETKECMYDMNAVQVSKVTMYYNGYVSVFDFQNPTTKSQSYTYSKKTAFTFTLEFNQNDPSKISNVILYVKTMKNEWIPLYPKYDADKCLWVTSAKSSELGNSYPVNVSVDFDVISEPVFDATMIEDYNTELQQTIVLSNDSIILIETLHKSLIAELEKNPIDEDRIKEINDSIDALLGLSKEELEEIDKEVEYLYTIWKDKTWVGEDGDDSEEKWCYYVSAYIDKRCDYEEDFPDHPNPEEFIDKLVQGEPLPAGTTTFVADDGNLRITYEKNAPSDNLSDYLKQEGVWEVQDNSDVNISYVELVNSVSKDRIILDASSRIGEPEFTTDGMRVLANSAIRVMNKYSNEAKFIAGISGDIYRDYAKYMDENYLMARRCLSEVNRLNRESSKRVFSALADNYSKRANMAKTLGKVAGGIGSIADVWSVGKDAYDGWNNAKDWDALIDRIGELCSESASADIIKRAKDYKGRYMRRYATKTFGGVSLTGIEIASTSASGMTLGVSLLIRAASYGIGKGLDHWKECYTRDDNNRKSEIRGLVNSNPDCKPIDDDDNDGGDYQSQTPDLTPCIDPSGYVYEGVSSNRLEGVMASCYYKETVEDIYGDQHENIVLWNAEQYAQENPLFTDANGMYRWDVPKGLWQVKFEKEGYETTYSEWLPVPPPQLEVNIPMVQNKQPEVADVHAYKDGVEIEFDKYMQPATLNTDNIFVTQNDEKVAGTVTLLNEEVAYEGQSETYASKVRFVFDQAVTAKEITLTVVNSVKSYAGLQMQDTYTQTFAIEQEVEGIVADSLVSMYYGGEHTLTVKVIPAAAAAGKTLLVTSSSPMILGVDTDSIVLDNSGEAVLTVSGELPGMGAISYSLVGYDYRASTLVEVVYNNTKMTANPTASIASGTTVAKGTEVTLSCTTEGAAIYYTLDGSCPCDDTAILYDGTPIVINENTELRIMAVAEGMYESDVVVYNYYVEGADVEEVTLPFAIDPTVVTDGFRVQGIEAECTVAVYGVGGELVMQREHVKNNTFINIAHVPEGMYIVVVSKDDDTHKQRILKVK